MFATMSLVNREMSLVNGDSVTETRGMDKVWKGFEHDLFQVANLLHNVNGKVTATPIMTTICLSPGWSKVRYRSYLSFFKLCPFVFVPYCPKASQIVVLALTFIDPKILCVSIAIAIESRNVIASYLMLFSSISQSLNIHRHCFQVMTNTLFQNPLLDTLLYCEFEYYVMLPCSRICVAMTTQCLLVMPTLIDKPK